MNRITTEQMLASKDNLGGQHGVYILVNSAVHYLMYMYCFASSYDSKYATYLGWKKFVTQIQLIWSTIMGLAEWNKKEELVAERALKHLRQYTMLLQAFTSVDRAELALILKVREFCYENMNFMKAFQKIILLFYKANVVSEDAIMKRFRDGHSQKGKMHFLEQMKKFIEWLQNAEEESESEEKD